MTHLEKLRLIADTIERWGIDDSQIVCCGTQFEPEIHLRSLDYAESLTPMAQRWAADGDQSTFHFFGVINGVEISAMVKNHAEEASPC